MPSSSDSRRGFLKKWSGLLTGLSGWQGSTLLSSAASVPAAPAAGKAEEAGGSIIGGYGRWAASLRPSPPSMSFRLPEWDDVEAWRKEAGPKALELLSSPRLEMPAEIRVEKEYVHDGLAIEELSWKLPHGRPTRAVVLKPADTRGPLPGILALHDHGSNKYFGWEKIARTSGAIHPLLAEHHERYYGGKAWAGELAKRGYVVMAHDTFAFGSRRVRYEDVRGIDWGPLDTTLRTECDPGDAAGIRDYNLWAADHEHVMSKSLFCAGTTWPGVFLAEDRAALSVLERRADVIPGKLGCGGLSGGGLRTAYLAGFDERIQCAVCTGFMTTWEDFLLNKAHVHTWMTYVPLLPNFLDFPEILGLRAPVPVMVQNNNQDALFTLSEMKRAESTLGEVYRKAGAADRYQCAYHEGRHKFDAAMQSQAFDWFERWL